MKYLIILLILISLVGFNYAHAEQTGKIEFVVDASNSGEGIFGFTCIGSGSVRAQSIFIDTSITNTSDPISLIKNHENLQNFYVRIFNVPDNFVTTNFECDASKIDLNESDRVTFKIVKNEEVKCTVHGAYVQSSTIPAQSDPQNGGNSNNNKDLIPPTIGMNSHHEREVENGFSFNGNTVNVDHEYTEFPLITTEVGEKNIIELVIYENYGSNYISYAHIGFGLKDNNTNIHESESMLGYHNRASTSKLASLDVIDKNNLMQNANMTSMEPFKCLSEDIKLKCLKMIFELEFREAPNYTTFVVQIGDEQGNNFKHYFNDGIKIIGEPLNEAPTDRVWLQKYIGNSQWEWLDIVRIDRINDIWESEDGIKFQKGSGGGFQRIGPINYQ